MKELSLQNQSIIDAYNKGYRITDSGKILNPKGIEISGTLNEKYKTFSFRFFDKSRSLKVHKLQAYQKYGNKIFETGIIVRHKNNNSYDNSKENILIGTYSENTLDIPLEKRIQNTTNSTKIRQKYSNELIIYIRYCYINKKYTQIELSRMFNIPKSGIHHIINNLYLFERIDSSNILNKKPDLEKFRNIDIEEILPEDIELHLNKSYLNNQYSDDFCLKLKNESQYKSRSELAIKYNISKGMIQYLATKF